MKEFALIFRANHQPEDKRSPAELESNMKNWMDWMGGIAAQNKLVSRGNRLAAEGKVLKPGNIITDGPYVETKEAIGGFIIISAADLNEAAEISKNCPILNVGGNVEIRTIIPMNN